jgi:hypothetical protein
MYPYAMNFDMPQAAKKEDDVLEINKDGSVEFNLTEAEKVAGAEAYANRINAGGDGKIMSSADKARGWFGKDTEMNGGDAKTTPFAEKVVDRLGEMPLAESPERGAGIEQPVEISDVPENMETQGMLLSRQMADIAGKRAEVLSQLIRTTDENEKIRLRKLEEAFQKGHEIKKRQYDALKSGQEDRVDSVAGEESLSV